MFLIYKYDMTSLSQTEYAEYKRTSNILNPNEILPSILDSHDLTVYRRYALIKQREFDNGLSSMDCSGVGFLPCPPNKQLPNVVLSKVGITSHLPTPVRIYNKTAVTSYPAYLNRVKSLNYKGLWINGAPMCNSMPISKNASYVGFNNRINTKTFMELTKVCN